MSNHDNDTRMPDRDRPVSSKRPNYLPGLFILLFGFALCGCGAESNARVRAPDSRGLAAASEVYARAGRADMRDYGTLTQTSGMKTGKGKVSPEARGAILAQRGDEFRAKC